MLSRLEDTPYTIRYRQFLVALVAARNVAGLTQSELAAQLNKPQSYVSKCESGERRLDIVELEMWCRALRVNAATFMANF